MKSYAEFIITPKELRLNKVIRKKILLEDIKDIVIEGKVLDSEYNPIEGAVIVVKSIDYNYSPIKIREVGYVITNFSGAYAIIIQKIENIDYKIEIYEPILTQF